MQAHQTAPTLSESVVATEQMRFTRGRGPGSRSPWLAVTAVVLVAMLVGGAAVLGGQRLFNDADSTSEALAGSPPASASMGDGSSLTSDPVTLATPDHLWPAPDFLAVEEAMLRVDGANNVLTDGSGFTATPGRTTFYKTGGMAASFGFDRDMVAVTASPDGLVAFTDPFDEGRNIYDPGPRTLSNIVVVDTSETRPLTFTFKGNIVPEVFTADGQGLFVIDHVSEPGAPASADPVGYRVLLLDFDSGELEPVLGPLKQPPGEYMEGIGRRQLGTTDENMLFTLYTRQPADHGASRAQELGVAPDGANNGANNDAAHDHAAHSHDDTQSNAEAMHGFVHTLSLTDEWAICIDLPDGFGQGPPESAAMALDGGGEHLFVIDSHAGPEPGMGQIAVFATASMTTGRVARDGIPKPIAVHQVATGGDATVHALVIDNSLVVAEDNRIQYLDITDDLAVTSDYVVEGTIEHLSTDDAGHPFAVVDDALVPLPNE